MNWQDFFKLKVYQGNEVFFEANLPVSQDFPMNALMMAQFNHLKLNAIEKKKLSLGLRKILVSHEIFTTKEFRQLCLAFKDKIERHPGKELTFSTSGGGIYLFLQLMKEQKFLDKRIVCYTSELPLPVISAVKDPMINFIFRPHAQSYLSDFSTLWKDSELMALFELKDFKASA